MMGRGPFEPPPPGDAAPSPAELDGLLAGAGYRVRSSDLRHVARGLSILDSAGNQSDPLLASGAHYNPSDLTAWVDSLLSEISPAAPPPLLPAQAAWTDQLLCPPPAVPWLDLVDEEDSGIRLVHHLMTTADAVHRGDSALALSLLSDMRPLLARVPSTFGIGKVAAYFADALHRRLIRQQQQPSPQPVFESAAAEYELLYHHFYEACPYLKFAHFTANQAILEAFDGRDRVHVVDFNLMHGLQWPALIQALALRPGGPPSLRLTGIGPPSPDGRDALREVGLRLAELARSVRVRFAFRGVAASRLGDVKPWMLQVAPGEAIAVNSVLQLHKLLGDTAGAEPIDSVLRWVVGLKPRIVTVVEQEADHNKPEFLDRFTEALFYYSTVFDSLEAGGGGSRGQSQQQQSAALAEVYLQREICNVVCCEGPSRTERHEPLAKWRARLTRAGLQPVHLGSNAFKQASMLLTLFSGEGYCVDEVDGCLTLGWHSRPLISASAWRAADADDDNNTNNNNDNDNNNNTSNNNNNNKHNNNQNYQNAMTSSSSSSNNNGSVVNGNQQQ